MCHKHPSCLPLAGILLCLMTALTSPFATSAEVNPTPSPDSQLIESGDLIRPALHWVYCKEEFDCTLFSTVVVNGDYNQAFVNRIPIESSLRGCGIGPSYNAAEDMDNWIARNMILVKPTPPDFGFLSGQCTRTKMNCKTNLEETCDTFGQVQGQIYTTTMQCLDDSGGFVTPDVQYAVCSGSDLSAQLAGTAKCEAPNTPATSEMEMPNATYTKIAIGSTLGLVANGWCDF